MNFKKKIIKNTLIGGGSSLLMAIAGFVVMPLMISRLGIVQYGLIGISQIFAIGGYIGLFELGFQVSISKYTAQFYQKGEKEKLCQLLNTTLLVLFMIGGILAIVGFFFAKLLINNILSIPENYLPSFHIVICVIFSSYFFEFPKLALLGFLEGLQKFSASRGIQTITLLAQSLGFILLVGFGYGYVEAVILMVITGLVQFILLAFFSFRHAPFLKIRMNYVRLKILHEIFHVTGYVFMGRILGFIQNNTDRLFIAIFLGPAIMTSYEAMMRVAKSVKMFLGFGNEAILPAASELDAAQDSQTMQKLFLRGLRYNLYISVPFASIAIYLMPDFILIWLGKDFSHVVFPIRVLLFWYLLTPLGVFGFSLLYGSGTYLKPTTTLTLVGTLLRIALVIFLIKPIGILAIAIGAAVPSIILLPFAIKLYIKALNVKFHEILESALPAFKSLLAPIFISVLFKVFGLGAANSYLRLFLESAILFFSYCGVCYFLFSNQQDRQLTKDLLNSILPAKVMP